jgi:hypothetical protein
LKAVLPPLHFVASLLVAVFFLLLQSYGLAAADNPWLHLDLVAIYVFYVGLEHHAFSATCKIIFLSLLQELWSAVPEGFYLTAHLLMMLVGNRLAVWLEMQRRSTQLLLFTVLLGMKEVLFALTARALGLEFSADVFAQLRFPGFCATIALAVPLMEMLSSLDDRFDRFVALRRGDVSARAAYD